MASSQFISSPYQPTFTAMMTGLSFGSFFAGLATLQTVAFFWINKRDPPGHKLLVILIWAADVLQIAFQAYSVYYCVIKEGREEIVVLPWTFRIQIFVVITIASMTKILYLVRLWKLNCGRKKIIPITLICLLFAELGFGVVSSYEMFRITLMPLLSEMRAKWAAFVTISLMTVNDVIISLALVCAFIKTNHNLSWTNSSMTMFCAYVMNTGFVAAIFSLIALVALSFSTTSPTFTAMIVILPQVYANCFLAMMNARFYFHSSSKLPCQFLPTHRRLEEGDGAFRSARTSTSPLYVQTEGLTINEIGFPLVSSFATPTAEGLSPGITMPLEVLVETRKERSVRKLASYV